MKIGPIPNGDCMPFILDVDQKWFAEKVVEYAMAGKDPADILVDELDRGMRAAGKAFEVDAREMMGLPPRTGAEP